MFHLFKTSGKRMTTAVVALVAVVLVAGTSSVAEAGQFPKTTIRFGSTSAENTIVVDTMKDFAKRVSAATDGNVTVMLFPASQLGSAKVMAQSSQMGALDMCITQPANLVDMGISEMAVPVLPYIFKSFEQRWKALTGDIGKEILQKVTDGGIRLHGVGFFLDTARNFFTVAGKPIRSIDDIKGMKLRVQNYEMDSDMAEALGASPTPTAASEMYSSLQSGIVDGVEQPIAAYYGNKFFEVSKYYTLDEHTYNTPVILYSALKWRTLSPELQAIVIKSWDDALAAAKEKILSTEAELRKKLEEVGVEVIELKDREKWVEATKHLIKKFAGDNMDLVNRINAIN